jgi:hypothetical protein
LSAADKRALPATGNATGIAQAMAKRATANSKRLNVVRGIRSF